MRNGETAELVIEPAYAYGRRGMPPVIKSNARLTFEVQVIATKGGKADDKRDGMMNVPEYNPSVARTPDEISRSYEARMQTQAERKANLTFFERFYFISPFASQTGQAPPWYLTPVITFSLIFVGVGVAFYLVVFSGGVHQGYVAEPIGALSRVLFSMLLWLASYFVTNSRPSFIHIAPSQMSTSSPSRVSYSHDTFRRVHLPFALNCALSLFTILLQQA
jgi:FKBP-type peptidyl-prolyl cis-trans isomerase